MSRPTEVRTLRSEEYEEWNRLVAESPSGSVYATPEYLAALCRSTGGGFEIRAVLQDDQIVGGVGLYHEPAEGRTVVSPRLLLYYNGPVLQRFPSRSPGEVLKREVATLAALEEDLREGGFGRVSLKSRSPVADVRPFLEQGWSAAPVYTLVVPLQDRDALWKRLDRNARRLVRRAEREGLTFSEDDDFESFFRMHRQIHKRKGAPLYLTERPFRAYFEALRASSMVRLYHARLPDGRSVSAQMVLADGHPVTHTVSAASDDDHSRTGASPFLRWKVCEELGREGYAFNDLTGAAPGPVTRFKTQLGGDLEVSMEVVWTSARFRVRQVPAALNRRGRRWARVLLAPLRVGGNVR